MNVENTIYKTNPSQSTKKRAWDAYFTPDWLAKICFEKVNNLIGDKIVEYIEPSAGDGVWLKYLNKPFKAYDIHPKAEKIIQANFLDLDIEFKTGRCLIGNPPYGRAGNLAIAFIKKGARIADYIAFILPASQYKNSYKFKEVDLIYSENLGSVDFEGHSVNCCFNIYKRLETPKKNTKPKLKSVRIVERRTVRKGKAKHKNIQYPNEDYDFRICAWGSAAGKIIKDKNKVYAKEFAFWIEGERLKKEICNLFDTKSIADYYIHTSTPNIVQWQVIKFIQDHIKGIE